MSLVTNDAAEQAVLGIMLLGTEATAKALAMLRSEDFARPRHKSIFAAVAGLWAAGVKPDVQLVEHELLSRGTPVRLAVLMALQSEAPSYSNVEPHARLVAEYATRRRLQGLASVLLEQASDAGTDLATVLSHAKTEFGALDLPLTNVADVWEADAFCDQPDPETDWVVPGLLDASDRTIVVAQEGAGKSVLLRQLAVMAGQGLHPFTQQRIPKVRSLLVDLENPSRIVRKNTRGVLTQVRNHVPDYEQGQTWIWHRPGGIDLRSRAGAAEFDSVCREVQPRLVCLGPLYKSYRADSTKREHDVASEVAYVLDDLRTRHGFAIVLEHHAPLKQGGVREMRPFGSLLWTQWPEVGIKLVPEDEKGQRMKVGTWRGSRDERPWPSYLVRGSTWPWEALYNQAVPV